MIYRFLRYVIVILVMLGFVAIIVDKTTSHRPEPARPTVEAIDGPSSEVIATGSVEARLRVMEIHILELRAEVETLRHQNGGGR